MVAPQQEKVLWILDLQQDSGGQSFVHSACVRVCVSSRRGGEGTGGAQAGGD